MNPLEPNKLLDAVDARTKLAGSNKMELLLFSGKYLVICGGDTAGIYQIF